MKTTSAIFLHGLLGVSGGVLQVTAGSAALPVPAYPLVSQALEVEGEPVEVGIAPLYNDKDWALTARWDDNHLNSLNMLEAMAALGLRGTFYLNASTGKFGGEFSRALSQKGSSVGGHTTSHGILPTQNTNTLFREILFNRIRREAETDRSINSFAFPYGVYSEKGDPHSLRRITDALLRSGYHHNVYQDFVERNPHMPPAYTSTGNQIVPGDHKIDAVGFRRRMTELLQTPIYRERRPVISLGVHPWQSEDELLKFKELLSEYAGRDDFWYSNQTELAAYRLQASRSVVSPVTAGSGRYTVTRPDANAAGADVPLTLRFEGGRPARVLLDGEVLDVYPQRDGSGWFANLPYPTSRPSAGRIDWVAGAADVSATAASSLPAPSLSSSVPLRASEKFPHLSAAFTQTADKGWALTLRNDANTPLENVQITLRLPALYVQGTHLLSPGTIDAGSSLQLEVPAGLLSEDPATADGALFAAAQIDFLQGGEAGRLYAVYEGKAEQALVEAVRDVAAVSGPFTPDGWLREAMLAASVSGQPLTAFNDTALGQWRTVDAKQRELYMRDRFPAVSTDAAWRKAASALSRKPSVVAVVLDVRLNEPAPVTFESSSPIVFAAMDGKVLKLEGQQTASAVDAGSHRLLLVIDTEGQYINTTMRFGRLALSANGKPVSLLPAPALR